MSRIANLNDAMRQALPEVDPRNRVLLTQGVQSLPALTQIGLAIMVRDFSAFTADNDPHGEHDFGSLELHGSRYFWKIDYYDDTLNHHSPDAADPAVTRRVLTIMRADE